MGDRTGDGMDKWSKLAGKPQVERAMAALQANGVSVYFVKTGEEARAKALSLMPDGAEVMSMSSTTLDQIGLAKEIMESGRYKPVKKTLMSMDRKTQGAEMQKIGAAPAYAVGSVHAVTEDGKLLVASQSGSQLPAYAYGSPHVIWVVGAQKIVKDMDEGFRRIYEHCLPLESERARQAYGIPGSSVNKVLVINKETSPGRLALIFVNQVLGF